MSLVTIKNFDVETAVSIIRDFNNLSTYTPYYKVIPPVDTGEMTDILIPLSSFFLRHFSVRWI